MHEVTNRLRCNQSNTGTRQHSQLHTCHTSHLRNSISNPAATRFTLRPPRPQHHRHLPHQHRQQHLLPPRRLLPCSLPCNQQHLQAAARRIQTKLDLQCSSTLDASLCGLLIPSIIAITLISIASSTFCRAAACCLVVCHGGSVALLVLGCLRLVGRPVFC